jgi:hypothetical protein
MRTLLAELEFSIFDFGLDLFEFSVELGRGFRFEAQDAVSILLGDFQHLFRGLWVMGIVPSYCASKSMG